MVAKYWEYEPRSHQDAHIKKNEEKILIPKNCGEINVSKLNRESVCYYHITYEFQIKSTFNNCLNVKELLTWNKPEV